MEACFMQMGIVGIAAFVGMVWVAVSTDAQTRRAREAPPARDPNTRGFVKAKELPDGEVPTADAEGKFVIGPTHKPALQVTERLDVPKGKIFDLVMKSQDSRMYPGIARERGTFGTPDPADPANL